MAPLLLLAALTAAPATDKVGAPPRMTVSASATASVRILPGAAVRFGEKASPGQAPVAATITVEDGSRRPAKLVEFQ